MTLNVFAIDITDTDGFHTYHHVVVKEMGEALQWAAERTKDWPIPMKEIKARFQGEVANG